MAENLFANRKYLSKLEPFSPNSTLNPKSLEINKSINAIVRNFRTKLVNLANFGLKLRTIAFVCLLIFKLVGLSAKLGEKGEQKRRVARSDNHRL